MNNNGYKVLLFRTYFITYLFVIKFDVFVKFCFFKLFNNFVGLKANL